VLNIARTRAQVRVQAAGEDPHQVEIALAPDGQIGATCDCARAELECRHKVAAFFELQRHLQEHPPCVWQQVLDEAVKPEHTRKSTTASAVIAFSLHSDNATYTRITPYSIARRHLPSELPAEGAELARVIYRRRGQRRARFIHVRIFPRSSMPPRS